MDKFEIARTRLINKKCLPLSGILDTIFFSTFHKKQEARLSQASKKIQKKHLESGKLIFFQILKY